MCIDVKIPMTKKIERINVYNKSLPQQVVQDFCSQHKLSKTTETYLIEKVLQFKTQALLKRTKSHQLKK